MLELGPSSLLQVSTCPEVQQVSMFGCGPDMCRTAFELLGCGVLKYTGKGSREFTCVSFEDAVKMMDLICKKQATPPRWRRPGIRFSRFSQVSCTSGWTRMALHISMTCQAWWLTGARARPARCALCHQDASSASAPSTASWYSGGGARLWKAPVPWWCCGRWFRKASSRTDRSMRSSV